MLPGRAEEWSAYICCLAGGGAPPGSSYRQTGHVLCLLTQGDKHAKWYEWPHGRRLSVSSRSKPSLHTAQLAPDSSSSSVGVSTVIEVVGLPITIGENISLCGDGEGKARHFGPFLKRSSAPELGTCSGTRVTGDTLYAKGESHISRAANGECNGPAHSYSHAPTLFLP